MKKTKRPASKKLTVKSKPKAKRAGVRSKVKPSVRAKVVKKVKRILVQKKKRLTKKQREAIQKRLATARINREKKQRTKILELRKAYEKEKRERRLRRKQQIIREREAREFRRYVSKKAQEEPKKELEDLRPEMDVETPQAIIDSVVGKMESFAQEHNYQAKISGSILSDLSIIIEMIFFEIEDSDIFLKKVSEKIQHLATPFKVSIAPMFDTSQVIKPFTMIGENVQFGSAGKAKYDVYMNMPIFPTNASASIPLQFLNMRGELLPKIEELTGAKAKTFRIVLMHGESVMGSAVPKRRILNPDYFK